MINQSDGLMIPDTVLIYASSRSAEESDFGLVSTVNVVTYWKYRPWQIQYVLLSWNILHTHSVEPHGTVAQTFVQYCSNSALENWPHTVHVYV